MISDRDKRQETATRPGRFSRFALAAAGYAGRPVTFALAVGVTLLWLLTGLYLGYSDTWQLTASTATSVVTFLMVFLIQHTQNRETRAVQIKLSELILVVQGARNALAAAETLPDEKLEELAEIYSQTPDAGEIGLAADVTDNGRGEGRVGVTAQPSGER